MSETSELIAEAGRRIELLSGHLPQVVNARSLSLTSKLPLKALTYREASVWRCEELARSAHASFANDDIVSGIVLTRALTETAAGVWYLLELVDRQLDNGVDPDLDDKLMRLLMGHKNQEGMPESLNALTFIDKMEKRIPGIRGAYDNMSECAHPNYAGTAGAYADTDYENLITYFRRPNRSTENHKWLGLNCLNGALGLLEFAYNQLSEKLPGFIEVCEASLRVRQNEA